jgi:bacteriocin-like protein
MKTINLRGITNPLSEEELKKVIGGANEKQPTELETVREHACNNSQFMGPCQLEWSGGTIGGVCRRSLLTGHLECWPA